jgi:predicted HTH domain antitoxin
MSQIVLDIPNETLLALKVSETEIGAALRMAAAARLAGIPRVVFLSRLADYGVDTFNLTEAQLQRETRLV